MSRKISDYFETDSKSSKLNSNRPQKSIKVIKLKENQQAGNESPPNFIKLRECKVVLSDIRNQLQNNKKVVSKNSKKLVKKPSILVKEQEFKCKYCGLEFGSSRKNWLYHVQKSHPDEEIFDCEFCKLRFPSLRSLLVHKGSIHKDAKQNNQQYECDLDGKVFKSISAINMHMKTHMSLVECTICHANLSLHWMETHMKVTHGSDEKPQCNICLKLFSSKSSLTKHKYIHDKKFKCDLCTRKFPSLSKLNIHKVVHKNLRSFKCNECDKEFNIKQYLKRHQKVHKKSENRFNCQKCRFSTDLPATFRSHEDTHKRQDDKNAAMVDPVKCDICSKLVKNKKALIQHKYFVHPKEEHQCDLCGKYLKMKHHIQRHIYLVHQSNKSANANHKV